MRTQRKECPHCHKVFLLKLETYGSVDENRTTYITCPYCNEIVEKDIRLSKCEELWTIKLEDVKEDNLNDKLY